jgi:hypothetical protein
MKIFGLDIKIARSTKLAPDVEFESFIMDCLTKCNNQLRGAINEKAKQYNAEILEYYLALVMEKSITFGIELEREEQRNNKIAKS